MFWPFALLASADQINSLRIDSNGHTSQMKFSKVSGQMTRLVNYHTFCCPVYILDARLQSTSGAGPPEWDSRCRLGIYVGHSPSHAGSVALVLNPNTGLISPQFHVVFDDNFSTIPYLRSGTVPDNWKQLVDNSREKSVEGFYDVTKTWFEGEADIAADAPTLPIMRSSDSQPVASREEDAAVATPTENTTTTSIAADEIVAAANPIDDIASLLPALPPSWNQK